MFDRKWTKTRTALQQAYCRGYKRGEYERQETARGRTPLPDGHDLLYGQPSILEEDLYERGRKDGLADLRARVVFP
jgi:hypothetical protein